MKTNCIVCNTEVDNWDIAYTENKMQVHPVGGTVFRTYGHYGSTVFDPMDASYLEVVVCDECLRSRMERTYGGVNEAYRKELDDRRAEMDKLIDEMIEITKDEIE
jgi:hypothetical protein